MCHTNYSNHEDGGCSCYYYNSKRLITVDMIEKQWIIKQRQLLCNSNNLTSCLSGDDCSNIDEKEKEEEESTTATRAASLSSSTTRANQRSSSCLQQLLGWIKKYEMNSCNNSNNNDDDERRRVSGIQLGQLLARLLKTKMRMMVVMAKLRSGLGKRIWMKMIRCYITAHLYSHGTYQL